MGERRTRGDAVRELAWWSLLATRTVLDAVLAVALSPVCASCDSPLDCPTEGPVCAGCWQSILPLTPPLCDRCGDPLRTWRVQSSSSHCPRCRRRRSSVDRARSIGAYDGALRAIVHALKYDGRRSLSRRLGALMLERGADILAGAAFVVPVPLHRSRCRQRGFNQAADLAGALGLPVCHALKRARPTLAQTSLPAARRHHNVRGAFAPTRPGQSLRGSTVVLVDDVCTTGATLDACARALKAVGVAEVRAITVARVVAPPR